MSKSHDIAVIPGDGTGSEVVEEGVKVLMMPWYKRRPS